MGSQAVRQSGGQAVSQSGSQAGRWAGTQLWGSPGRGRRQCRLAAGVGTAAGLGADPPAGAAVFCGPVLLTSARHGG